MNTSFENRDKESLAICRNRRDLRTASNTTDELDLQRELDGLDERAISRDKLETLKPAFSDDRPRIDPIKDVQRDQPPLGAVPWRKPIIGRMLLVVLTLLAVGAVTPFAWSYLQSYESTDDAQIDGHIDPLSSRIDGTVIGVHAEDDDRVTKGELLVEIDPRDYETMLERRTQYHQSVLVSHLSTADGTVQQFVNSTSHYSLTRGTSGPDAIHQSYGLVSSLMTQQATMLAAMDCFHLLGLVVLLGLPLAFLIRRFQIGSAGGAAH